MHNDRIENLLYEKFYRADKFRLPAHSGVLTASNDYMFAGLQFLYCSIALSHVADICVIDCGLTEEQRAWCEAAGMRVVALSPDEMIFKDVAERKTHIWNKAAYIEKSPFRRTLWIDSDCVVMDNLEIFFDLLEDGPVFTEDHFAPRAMMANHAVLYMMMPIYPNRRGRVYLNSGVMAFDNERDREVIRSWQHCVRRAAEDKDVRDALAWYDQGALMWAVDKHGLGHRIRRERAFNFPATVAGGHWGEAQQSVQGFLDSLGREPCVIKHYMSHPKPWHHWRKGGVTLDFSNTFSSKVKLFVLSHNQGALDNLPDRPYFEKICLGDLPLGRYQTNQLAESRIFLSPFLHRVEHEYVGFASARWNDKYSYLGITKLEDFYHLKSLLKPTNVIVAQRTDNENGPLGSLDPINWRTHFELCHPGIVRYLRELSAVTKIDNRNPSFWANNFICHRTVFREFLDHWLTIFFHFYEKYRLEYDFETLDESRRAAFLMEAITVNYFSSRTDLNIVEATKRDIAYRVL